MSRTINRIKAIAFGITFCLFAVASSRPQAHAAHPARGMPAQSTATLDLCGLKKTVATATKQKIRSAAPDSYTQGKMTVEACGFSTSSVVYTVEVYKAEGDAYAELRSSAEKSFLTRDNEKPVEKKIGNVSAYSLGEGAISRLVVGYPNGTAMFMRSNATDDDLAKFEAIAAAIDPAFITVSEPNCSGLTNAVTVGFPGVTAGKAGTASFAVSGGVGAQANACSWKTGEDSGFGIWVVPTSIYGALLERQNLVASSTNFADVTPEKIPTFMAHQYIYEDGVYKKLSPHYAIKVSVRNGSQKEVQNLRKIATAVAKKLGKLK
jgi:hypothetical protein